MKKIFLIFGLLLILNNPADALGIKNQQYLDAGWIYSKSTFPQSTYKVGDSEDTTIPDLSKLKKGESRSVSFLRLVERGNGSIHKAAKNAGITKIYYVDYKINKAYAPIGFIPIYLKEKKTIVYGE